MTLPLQEDFSDVAEFVQEDDSYTEQTTSEDEVERKIAEEHAKYREAQAKRQEEVRASRPWSAPPIESPRPEQQKEREKERQARGSNSDAAAVDAPRAEYEPPVRPYLLQAQASGSGNSLSYLSRPQSAELRSGPPRLLNGRASRASLSGIEEDPREGTAPNSRQPSEMDRLGSTIGEARSSSGVAPDDAPSRDQYGGGVVMEELEGGEASEPTGTGTGADIIMAGRAGTGQGAAEPQQQFHYHGQQDEEAAQVGDEADAELQAAEEEEDAAERRRGAGAYGSEEGGGVPGGSNGVSGLGDGGQYSPAHGYSGLLGASAEGAAGQRSSEHRVGGWAEGRQASEGGEVEERWDGQVEENEVEEARKEAVRGSGGWARASEVNGSRYGKSGPPSVAASVAVPEMAMRGFVEPIGYETSYSKKSSEDQVQNQLEEEDEEEAYGEDSFEEDTETRDEEASRRGTSPANVPAPPSRESSVQRSPLSKEPSALRTPLCKEPSAVQSTHSVAQSSASGRSPRLRPTLSQELSQRSMVASTSPMALPPLPTISSASSASTNDPPILPQPTPLSTPTPPTRPASTAGSLPPIQQPEADQLLPPSVPSPAHAAASPTTLAGSASQRSSSSSAGTPAPSPQPATPPPQSTTESDLLPAQQFALQLLKHDIDVLPQHHKAAAEAAMAARRKAASAARPAGSGLAAFGYLGYHLVSEELTAPSGPAFRTISPGRASSPGREGSAQHAALMASASLKAVRVGPPEGSGAAGPAAGRVAGRPISAPHIRPNGRTSDVAGISASGEKGARGSPARVRGEDPSAAAGGGTQPVSTFLGAAREMRGNRLLPPVAPAGARNGRTTSGGGDPPTERSLSVLDEEGLSSAQTRIKFDVWLNSLGGGPAALTTSSTAPGAKSTASGGGTDIPPMSSPDNIADGTVRRVPRPMTAPASGRRRPMSARPAGSPGTYGVHQPAARVPPPLARPLSAQPHYLRPASASRNTSAMNNMLTDAIADATLPPPVALATDPAPAMGGTAAVEVGGVTVSVYVADTLKRIVEANRWLQQLGVTTRRYRLKDRLSNMVVQLCEELPPLLSERVVGDGPYDSGATAVVKELTLKQFLSGHAKLKQHAKKHRQQTASAAAAAASASAAAAAMAMMLPAQTSAMQGGDFSVSGGGAGGRPGRPLSAVPMGSNSAPSGVVGGRVRPASAMPHSGIRVTTSTGGGTDPSVYRGAFSAGSGTGLSRPVRPNSANPAYGRTPSFTAAYGSVSATPPAASGSLAYPAATGAARQGVASPGVTLPAPRAAWGSNGAGGNTSSGGAYSPYLNAFSANGTGSGQPYATRSVSANKRAPPGAMLAADDGEGEEEVVIESEDLSRSVRQQLGGAVDYCLAKRQEIAMLRALPLS